MDGSCKVAGRFNKQSFSLIDKNNPAIGVVVEYGGGDVCHTRAGFARVTKIYAYCDPLGRSYSKDVVDEPDGPKACEYEIKFHSSAACQQNVPSVKVANLAMAKGIVHMIIQTKKLDVSVILDMAALAALRMLRRLKALVGS